MVSLSVRGELGFGGRPEDPLCALLPRKVKLEKSNAGVAYVRPRCPGVAFAQSTGSMQGDDVCAGDVVNT